MNLPLEKKKGKTNTVDAASIALSLIRKDGINGACEESIEKSDKGNEMKSEKDVAYCPDNV